MDKQSLCPLFFEGGGRGELGVQAASKIIKITNLAWNAKNRKECNPVNRKHSSIPRDRDTVPTDTNPRLLVIPEIDF